MTARSAAAFRPTAIFAFLLLLPGCKAVGEIAGVAAGVAGGTATGNPAAGFAIGVVTNAGVDELVNWIDRSRQGAEQAAIAQIAGRLAIGQSHPWRIRHTIPIGNEHGTLRVVAVTATPLTTCKEVVFSVDDDDDHAPGRRFTTAVCRQGKSWRWALAEPAVQRWGYLQ